MDNPYAFIFVLCLVLGLLSGIIMHRSDFCIAGMFRDLFLLKRTVMLRMLLLLVAVSMLLFELLRLYGIALYPFPPTGSPSPAAVIGGLFFGIGMVLAGGCVAGTLYKMGAGSFLSFISFVGIIAGSLFYAEIHPWWTAFVKRTTIFQGRVTIPQIIGIDPGFPVIVLMAIASCLFFRWYKEAKWERPSVASGYIQPWKAAIFLAFIGLISYMAVGKPMGVTTGYTKLGAYLEYFLFKGHLEGTAFFKAKSLDYVHPLTSIRMQGGAGPGFDVISAIEFPLIIGIIFGSALSSFLLKEFRLCFRVPYRQYISSFAGGFLMGIAARLSQGCNVAHLLGGLPLLTGQSILFLVGLFPGAWLGSRIFVNFVMSQGGQRSCR
jgi:uncharacterized membrane protein YedE/YeeE